jgi:deoxyribonuclease V
MPYPAIPIPEMAEELQRLLAQVPRGRVTTYGALAEALGNRIAARWVGQWMMHHRHGPACGCHRVLLAGGVLGGYAGGESSAKASRLAREGIEVRDGRVELARYGWDEFRGDQPLETLRQIQDALARSVVLRARRRMPRRVGGVDVSYAPGAEAVAAFALVDCESGTLVWSTTLRGPVRFPYISSYLAFREMPLLMDLLGAVRAAGQLPDVVLVDGAGILHQRHAGIAAHLGVAAGLATIGVTKKLLCGRVDLEDLEPGQSRPVLLDDQIVGAALRPTAGSRRPIFVSPGHSVDLRFSERVVRQLLLGRRLPEPLYWADWLSRAAARGRM